MKNKLKIIFYTTVFSLGALALVFAVIARKAIMTSLFQSTFGDGNVSITSEGASASANGSQTQNSNVITTAPAKSSARTRSS